MQYKTLKQKIAEAVTFHAIESVVAFPPNKELIVCPLPFHRHTHNTPSFSIFFRDGKQYWKCHGYCHREGDVIDLVGFLYIPGYDRHNPKMVEAAIRRLDDRYEPVIVKVKEEPKLVGNEWKLYLPPGLGVIEYAVTRGLTPETLEKFWVGQRGRAMAIPCFEYGELRGIKFRSIDPTSELRYWSLKGSRQGLFNFDRIKYTTKPVLIVKAEIPCMLLDQCGFLACAPSAGEGGWQEEWRTALALSAKRIVVGDNDAPGVELGQKRAAFLAAELKFPPPAFKDVDQWVLADKDPALETIRRWMEE